MSNLENNKNIALFSHSAYSGGAEHALLNLAILVKDCGHSPTVYLPKSKNPDLPIRLDLAKIPVSYFDRTSIFGHTANAIKDLANKDLTDLLEQLRTQKTELIISNTSTFLEGALAAHALGLPHIWAIHEMQQKNPSTPKGGLAENALARWFIETSDHRLYASKSALLAHELDDDDRFSCSVLAPFLELEGTTSEVQIQRSPKAPNLNLYFVGAPTEGKNPLFAIEVTALLRREGLNARLFFIGGRRDHTGKINALLSRRNLQPYVRLLGKVKNPYDYFVDCAINLISSRSEAFGLSVPESLIRGIPVVAPNFDGPSELLDLNCQYVPEDIKACADVIKRIAGDYNRASDAAKRNYELIRNRFCSATQRAVVANVIQSATRNYRPKNIPQILQAEFVRSVLYPTDLSLRNILPLAKVCEGVSGAESFTQDQLRSLTFVLLRLCTERDNVQRNLRILVADKEFLSFAKRLALAGFEVDQICEECEGVTNFDQIEINHSDKPNYPPRLLRLLPYREVQTEKYDAVLAGYELENSEDIFRRLKWLNIRLLDHGLLFADARFTTSDRLRRESGAFEENRSGLIPFYASQLGFKLVGWNYEPYTHPYVFKKTSEESFSLLSSLFEDPNVMSDFIALRSQLVKPPQTKKEKIKYGLKRLVINCQGSYAKWALFLKKKLG